MGCIVPTVDESPLNEDGQAPYFDRDMLLMEGRIAGPEHHELAFRQLARVWWECVTQWPDRPAPVDQATVDTLVLTLWGARRYSLLLDGDSGDRRRRVEQCTRMARALLTAEA